VKFVATAAVLYAHEQRRYLAFPTGWPSHDSIGTGNSERELDPHAASPSSLYLTIRVSEYRQAMHSKVRWSCPARSAGSMRERNIGVPHTTQGGDNSVGFVGPA